MLRLHKNIFPADPKQYAVIYQWWTMFPQMPVRRITSVPLLQSMSTLREHCPDVPVYVLDYSEDECNWEDFPERLGFQVVRQRCGLADISFRYKKMPFNGEVDTEDRVFREHLSRPLDVWGFMHRIPERYAIYSDSDILWRRSCIPHGYDADYLHCRDYNTGVFFFDKTASKVEEFFYTWMGLAMLASRNRSFRKRMYKDQPLFNAVQDEMVYVYIRQSMPEHFRGAVKELPITENMCPEDFGKSLGLITSCRALHMQQTAFGPLRGIVPWLLKEFSAIMEKWFKEDELHEIFGRVYDQKGKYSLSTIRDGIWHVTTDARREYEGLLRHIDFSADKFEKPSIYFNREGQ